MPLKIIRNDITLVKADAIVDTANPQPIYAGGTDYAIYTAAGAEKLLEERKKIGTIARGDAAITPAFALNASFIIHTVGPVWNGGNDGEFDTLASCYRKSLALAVSNKCTSVAFPLIATGVYGFPKDRALQIAIREIGNFLMEYDEDLTVYLVVFDSKAFQLSRNVFGEVQSFIDENYVETDRQKRLNRMETTYATEFNSPSFREKNFPPRRRRALESNSPALKPDSFCEPCCDIKESVFTQSALRAAAHPPAEADGVAESDNITFQEKLFELIDQSGLSNKQVYTGANIDRKHFSKIQCNPDYHPSKKTALAFCISLKLSYDESCELLSRADWAFNPGKKLDLIVKNAIISKNYNIHELNAVLFDFCKETLPS